MQLDFVTNKGIMQMVKSYEIHTKGGADLKYAPLFALFRRKNLAPRGIFTNQRTTLVKATALPRMRTEFISSPQNAKGR